MFEIKDKLVNILELLFSFNQRIQEIEIIYSEAGRFYKK